MTLHRNRATRNVRKSINATYLHQIHDVDIEYAHSVVMRMHTTYGRSITSAVDVVTDSYAAQFRHRLLERARRKFVGL